MSVLEEKKYLKVLVKIDGTASFNGVSVEKVIHLPRMIPFNKIFIRSIVVNNKNMLNANASYLKISFENSNNIDLSNNRSYAAITPVDSAQGKQVYINTFDRNSIADISYNTYYYKNNIIVNVDTDVGILDFTQGGEILFEMIMYD